MISDISDFYKSKVNDKTLFSFLGELSPDLVTSLLTDLEIKLDEVNEEKKVRKRLYNILTELLQNLYHHSDERERKEDNKTPSSICVVDLLDDAYKITTANYIRNYKIDGFRKKLERVNEMSPEELKEYYLQVLNNGEKSDKDGAGLGMIEISRKTGDKLNFEFLKLDDNFSLFVLNSKLLK